VDDNEEEEAADGAGVWWMRLFTDGVEELKFGEFWLL